MYRVEHLSADIFTDIADTTIFISDSYGAAAHRKILRKWNQLSRFQRSLVYVCIALLITLIILLYTSKEETKVHKYEAIHSKLALDKVKVKNESLVTKRIVPEPKFIPKEVDNNEIPRLELTFYGPTNERQQLVVGAFEHAWNGYKQHAWGHDNLRPVTGGTYDWFSLGLTIVDSLDTAYIMGLHKVFEEGKEWIRKELIFTRDKDVNFFEVTIRVLGALLTNYHFTNDDMFLQKAEDLGDRLMAAFSSPSGIPYSDVNLGTRIAHAPEWFHYSSTAEVTTIQLEFRELSRASKNSAYEDAAAAVSEKIHNLPKKSGLVPIYINPSSGKFLPHVITLGARGDSYYEYLLKQWIQTGKTLDYLLHDYLTAIEGVREFLAKRSSANKYLFIGELTAVDEVFNPKMDHLTCFLPGTLALGHANGLPDWHLTMAEELLYTCYLTYAVHPTYLAPEITHFNMISPSEDMYTKSADAHSLLRPEFVESLWYMYQLTGNTTYQDWGWQIFQSFEKYAKTTYGYSSLDNVRSDKPQKRDMMESFFLSETLKYLYLLFSDDRYMIDLRTFVMTTEAHPLPIRNK